MGRKKTKRAISGTFKLYVFEDPDRAWVRRLNGHTVQWHLERMHIYLRDDDLHSSRPHRKMVETHSIWLVGYEPYLDGYRLRNRRTGRRIIWVGETPYRKKPPSSYNYFSYTWGDWIEIIPAQEAVGLTEDYDT
jgi:hypothetical protein